MSTLTYEFNKDDLIDRLKIHVEITEGGNHIKLGEASAKKQDNGSWQIQGCPAIGGQFGSNNETMAREIIVNLFAHQYLENMAKNDPEALQKEIENTSHTIKFNL